MWRRSKGRNDLSVSDKSSALPTHLIPPAEVGAAVAKFADHKYGTNEGDEKNREFPSIS